MRIHFSEFGSIHQEIKNLKDENTNQNLEISLLKEKIKSQDRVIHQKITKELNKLLVTPETNHHFPQNTPAQRSKRPVRLLPAKFWQGGSKNDTNQHTIPRFYGPPSNCSDLSLLGYTLNGYYLVKQAKSNN